MGGCLGQRGLSPGFPPVFAVQGLPASFQGAEGLVHGGVVPVEESDLGEEGGVFQGLGHLFSFEEGAVHPQHKGALGVLGEPGQSAGQFPAMPLVEEFQVEGARGFVPAEGEVGDDEEPPLFLEGGELLQELPGGGRLAKASRKRRTSSGRQAAKWW